MAPLLAMTLACGAGPPREGVWVTNAGTAPVTVRVTLANVGAPAPPTPATRTLAPGEEVRTFYVDLWPPEVECGGTWTRLWEPHRGPAGTATWEVTCTGGAVRFQPRAR